ncbi:energy-coupling factor transport system ATP-binding protein [Thermosyntropha lipolytica DSM 11003]|uniref:Energy-coupling factor transport system ATP-binding protein n=1 Tax=Thermosyntropha lipolytica DSM 11003 TaxID=1123382 RepID=A0A1M5QCM4_9FIRM|nr:ATP-binding cassette domain-containing protein [Thermosyntropha lipolytica]SHH11807.1 energy-coupling factor transport system ATP-binding protein [Thermosyntropha lipolytica DSM 11003]
MEKIKIENLTYCYPGREEPALKGINLILGEGEFVLLIGESGSGKSTLLKVLSGLIPDFYGGSYEGEVYIDGLKLRRMRNRERARKLGFLGQNPENQLFTARVEKELVLAMENLGFTRELMRKRVAETAGFFNLTPYLKSKVAWLSGGMKQKLALASLTALGPEVLLLDEPLSQLDPQSAEEILNLLVRLNQEYGITVVMAEQRLEKCLSLADRVVWMEKGEIRGEGTPEELGSFWGRDKLFLLPSLPRLFALMGEKKLPLTVKEGRKHLAAYEVLQGGRQEGEHGQRREAVLQVKGLWYAYPPGKEVLKNLNFTVYEHDIWIIMGENGAGKTTLLKVLSGLLPASRGKVLFRGEDLRDLPLKEKSRRIAYIPQNPDDYFFLPTVREEVIFNLEQTGKNKEEADSLLEQFGLASYHAFNPRDLSMGEKQRLLLACVAALEPEILLMDEPTRGLDYKGKERLGRWLKDWGAKGKAALIVSHDVEFAAEYGEKVMLLFDGEIAAQGSKYQVMDNSLFYSPDINRLFASRGGGILTCEEACAVLSRGRVQKQVQ